jgi:hypothetical protein
MKVNFYLKCIHYPKFCYSYDYLTYEEVFNQLLNLIDALSLSKEQIVNIRSNDPMLFWILLTISDLREIDLNVVLMDKKVSVESAKYKLHGEERFINGLRQKLIER